MEYIEQIVNTTLNSFDFSFCLIVNILTYLMIKFIDELNKEKEVSKLVKRIVMFIAILSTGVVYFILNQDTKLIINSSILAPVSWDFVFKPILNKLGIDYKKNHNNEQN